jgi:hypothetical protein
MIETAVHFLQAFQITFARRTFSLHLTISLYSIANFWSFDDLLLSKIFRCIKIGSIIAQ